MSVLILRREAVPGQDNLVSTAAEHVIDDVDKLLGKFRRQGCSKVVKTCLDGPLEKVVILLLFNW